MLNEEIWFGYPFWSQNLKFNENDELKKFCLSVRKLNEGVKESNIGGWQSNAIHKSDILILQKFENFLSNLCVPLSIKFNTNFRIGNYWININDHGNENDFHHHPKSDMSGVYYVKADSNQGDLIFKSPSIEYDSFSMALNFNQFIKFYPRKLAFNPKTGKTVFFLPHIPHKVEPNQTFEERISIAFNLVC